MDKKEKDNPDVEIEIEIDGDDKETSKKKKDEKCDKDMKESLEEIFGSADLSESAQNQVSALFEAELSKRTNSLREEITQEVTNELEESVDKYVSFMAEQYIKENEIAIQEGMKVDFAIKVFDTLKSLFEEVGVEIPDEKIDAYEALEESYNKLENRLNSVLDETISLRTQLEGKEIEAVIDSVSENLTVSQKNDFVSLIENIAYDKNSYKEKLEIIREKYFSETKKTPVDENNQEKALDSKNLSESTNADKYAQFI